MDRKDLFYQQCHARDVITRNRLDNKSVSFRVKEFVFVSNPYLATAKGISLRTAIVGASCHKYHFCSDNFYFLFFYFSQQTRKHIFCRDKTFVTKRILFVATDMCLSRQTFIATNKILTRQRFCRYKHTLLSTKDVFYHDKNYTSVSCRQWYTARTLSVDPQCGPSVRTATSPRHVKTTELSDTEFYFLIYINTC